MNLWFGECQNAKSNPPKYSRIMNILGVNYGLIFYSIVIVVLLATVASNSYPNGMTALEPHGNGKRVKQKITTDNAVRFCPWI